MRMVGTYVLSLLLAGGLCFCFRVQELVVKDYVDSVVPSIVYTSAVGLEMVREEFGMWWRAEKSLEQAVKMF
jgi:hypothetical protein